MITKRTINCPSVHALLFPVLLATGCVDLGPVRDGGVLSTHYGQRFTDEVVRRDWQAIEGLRADIEAVRPQARIAYAIARADAQLQLAIDLYEANDASGWLERLLDDARALAHAQASADHGEFHPVPVPYDTPPLPARSTLHERIETIQANARLRACAGAPLASLEVALAHEAHEAAAARAAQGSARERCAPVLVDALAQRLQDALAGPSCAGPQPAPLQTLTLSAGALFAFNRCGMADMLAEGRAELDATGAMLQAHADRGRRLQVVGHTDRLGRLAYNITLSQCRADTVRDYLVNRHGVPRERILTLGVADTEPLVHCPGSRGDAVKRCLKPNRRVEIVMQ